MTENANWKEVGDVYRTNGPILMAGDFVTRDGKRITLTPEDVDYLHNNISEQLPFVIDHDKYAETIGYAVKFAKDGETVEHGGIVFNQSEFRDKVILGGYNNISPEIDFVYDQQGNVIDKRIVKLAFVKNPAIKGNKTEVTRFAFSAPEVNSMTTGDGSQATDAGTSPSEQTTTTAPANVDYTAIVEAIATGLSSKIDVQFNEMRNELNTLKQQVNPPKPNPAQEYLASKTAETPKVETTIPQANDGNTLVASPDFDPVTKDVFDEYARVQAELQATKAENDKYRAETEKAQKSQYNNIVGELKALGYANPEKLVSSIDSYAEKANILRGIKENHVKHAPMNSSNNTPMNSEGGTQSNKATISGAVEGLKLKLSPEELEYMSKKFGIPAR
jgi:hypothetical protein